MNRAPAFIVLTTLALALTARASFAAMVYSHGWDGPGLDDSFGYQPFGAASHSPNGGNPGGFVRLSRNASFQVFGVGTARPEFQGDYAAAGITAFAVDVMFLTEGESGSTFSLGFDSHSLNASASIGLTFATSYDAFQWLTITVAFDPTWTTAEAEVFGWQVQVSALRGNPVPPDFSEVMASVSAAEMYLGFPTTETPRTVELGVDNFRLLPTPGVAAILIASLPILTTRRRQNANT